MGIFGVIWLVLLGILGASNLIIARKPEAKELIAKMAPYQGWFGAVSAILGLLGLIFTNIFGLGIFALGLWGIIWWVTSLAGNLVMVALGLLFGVGVLKTFIKQPQAVEKLDEMVAKLAPYQAKLGLISIGVGVWGLLVRIIWF
jgi:hypothetical protein